MKKFIANGITIIFEIILSFSALVIYLLEPKLEFLYALIVAAVALFIGITTKLTSDEPRPKIVLNSVNDYNSKTPKGYTSNNPRVIRLGIDEIQQFWELKWVYDIDIRNNSSVTAYNLEFDFENKPPKSIIDISLEKNQPIKSDEKEKATFKLYQSVIGSGEKADEYLKNNAVELLKNVKIIVKYRDEFDNIYKTQYRWISDNNKFPSFNIRSKIIIGISIILILASTLTVLVNIFKSKSLLFNTKNIKTDTVHKTDTIHKTDTVFSEKTVIRYIEPKQSFKQEKKEEVSTTPTYNISSNGQSGGITANEVNIVPPSQKVTLNDNLKNQILKVLPTDKSEKIEIMSVSGNSVSYNLGEQIYKYIKDLGYKNSEHGSQMIFPQPIGIKYFRKNTSISQNFTIEVGLLDVN